MFVEDNDNALFSLASRFVCNTGRHVFLTGKAGTGKTTFLKQLCKLTTKNLIVTAPTGVAAIHAGGVTLHSFFQLPFGPYLPEDAGYFSQQNNEATNRHTLFRNLRISNEKREIMEELELLVIDEVSMMRCDMLDALDAILRHFRKQPYKPFGGVQVLYVGDLYQLPPVVKTEDWNVLGSCYEHPFFFAAKVIQQAPPLYIELKKNYRQNEQQFIELLNRVRNNVVTDADIELLNNRYNRGFTPVKEDEYITLTTHNNRAEAINREELAKLGGREKVYSGIIEGEFSDKSLPTDLKLSLKEGAQVMFVKNDSGNDRRYFNGKLAVVEKINGETITVSFPNNDPPLELKKETWHNIKYTLNKSTNRVEEETMGSFTQYPIRLAWAITIHKSQGLTFDRVIIDAGASFAAGQVYVALSRCTTLGGIVLYSKIYPESIHTDERVIAFANREAKEQELEQMLLGEEKRFLGQQLINHFDFTKVQQLTADFLKLVPGKKLPDAVTAMSVATNMNNAAKQLVQNGGKFQRQLELLVEQANNDDDSSFVVERGKKAVDYFSGVLLNEMVLPLQQHLQQLKHAARLRKYVREAGEILEGLSHHIVALTKVRYDDVALCEEPGIWLRQLTYSETEKSPASKSKPVKGASRKESLDLYREGKTIAEIAAMRQLVESTVAGHLAAFVRTGELNVEELVSPEKIAKLLPMLEQLEGQALAPIKELLGPEFGFHEIRAVFNHLQWQRDLKEKDMGQ